MEGLPCSVGLRIVRVSPGTAAEQAGLQVGDVICALEGTALDGDGPSRSQRFRELLGSTRPGQKIRLVILRQELELQASRTGQLIENPRELAERMGSELLELQPGESLELRAARTAFVLQPTVVLGASPEAATPPDQAPLEPLHAALQKEPVPEEELALRFARADRREPEFQDLRERLARLGRGRDETRLEDVRFLLREPFRMRRLAEYRLTELAPPGRAGSILPAELLHRAEDVLDLPPGEIDHPALRIGLSLEEHFLQIEEVLIQAAQLRGRALEPLTRDQRELLEEHLPGLGEGFLASSYLEYDPEPLRWQRNQAILEAAPRIDRRRMNDAALCLTRLLEPAYLEGLRRDLAGLEADPAGLLIRRETPYGPVLIGGPGRNVYRGFDAAVILDLGGDDIYHNNAGGSRGDRLPVALVVDFDGDDAYESTSDGAQGCGWLGVGMLLDRAGNDSYIGQRWCQGAAALGIGLLLDRGGNDRYRCQELGQACGLYGSAHLVDAAGEDEYSSHQYAQALALPQAAALLWDGSGDDRYYCKGRHATGYGDPGQFDGWSQGCAVGFRLYQSGGAAFLVEGGGADRYEAGHFSQGGGYYFGWGVLEDRGAGDDRYLGSRYNQGFCAHQALGTFLERGGDDRYETRYAVMAGLAWDESVTWFEEAGGRDRYDALDGFFSLGASAHNSICLFADRTGADIYKGTVPGRAGGNDYHGGTSLSLFLDLGRGEDRFSPECETQVFASGEHSLFVHLPGSLPGLLKPRSPLVRALDELPERHPE